MEKDEKIDQSDKTLVSFVTSATEEEADSALTELLREQVQPQIEKILRGKFHATLKPTDFSPANQDALEVAGAVKLLLISELIKLRSNNNGRVIQNLCGYTTSVTLNVYRQYLRDKYPLRQRLKNKLRYLLSHHPNFDLWEDENGNWLCGFKTNKKSVRPVNKETVRAKIETAVRENDLRESSRVIDLLAVVFESAKAPIMLNDLLSIVAEVQEIKERTEASEVLVIEKTSGGFENTTLTAMEQRRHLEEIWKEISALPLRHRLALLLNLRNKHGDCLIALLPLLRIASVRQIAAVLEFPAEEFARVWNELPWDDLRIAGYLKLTRQQVINLRQSARTRLSRLFAEK